MIQLPASGGDYGFQPWAVGALGPLGLPKKAGEAGMEEDTDASVEWGHVRRLGDRLNWVTKRSQPWSFIWE